MISAVREDTQEHFDPGTDEPARARRHAEALRLARVAEVTTFRRMRSMRCARAFAGVTLAGREA
jgi:hypothetical protein